MWTDTTRALRARRGLNLPSDLTDAEWAVLEPLLPPASHVGRSRKWPTRRIVEAMLYLLRGGLPWRMLPPCFPPVSTVRRWFLSLARRQPVADYEPCAAHGFVRDQGSAGLAVGGGDRIKILQMAASPLAVRLGSMAPSQSADADSNVQFAWHDDFPENERGCDSGVHAIGRSFGIVPRRKERRFSCRRRPSSAMPIARSPPSSFRVTCSSGRSVTALPPPLNKQPSCPSDGSRMSTLWSWHCSFRHAAT